MDADHHLSGAVSAETVGARRRLDPTITALLVTVALALFAVAAAGLAGFRLMVVRTGSMSPTLRPGDVVVSRYEPAGRLQPGDVVTFVDPALHARITHRVVNVHGDGSSVLVTTRGDANTVAETWRVPSDEPIAKRVFRVPRIPHGYAWAVLGLAVAGSGFALRRRRGGAA